MLKALLKALSKQAKDNPDLPLFTSMDIVEIRVVLENYIQHRIEHDRTIESLLGAIEKTLSEKE